jgi:2'-5' RNA ligase
MIAPDVNALLAAGRRRAERLAPTLARLVQDVLDEAVVEAVARFRRIAAPPALVAAAPTSLSAMVAVYPLADEQAALAQPEGEPAPILHVTLAFLGETDDETLARADLAMRQVARDHVPREGRVGGVGYFGVEPGPDAVYPSLALPDVPGLPELRHAVVRALEDAGVPFSQTHGWLPHLTLAYTAEPTLPPPDVLGRPVTFRFLTLARGDVPVHIGLSGAITAGAVVYDGDDETALAVANVAAAHAPEGGYGDTYWHAGDAHVYWVSADWSSSVECDAAVAAFEAIEGVRQVEDCDECGAPAGDGWDLVYASGAGGNASALAAAADPPNWVPPSGAELVDVDELARNLRERTEHTRSALIESVMTAHLDPVGVAWDTTNPLIAKALASTGRHIVGVAETTKIRVGRAVDAAYREGLSIPHAAEAIQSQMLEANAARAVTIARTELVRAVNSASVNGVAIVSDVTAIRYVKVWLTAPGAEHPRHEDYDDLDGQTAELDGYFNVGGYDLEYPGDDAGPPEEVINCRCTMEYQEEGASA